MGSVSVNPGVTGLLKTLTSLNSPLMTSKTALAALKNASVSDIVQLSVAASKLAGIKTLFSAYSTPAPTTFETLFGLPAHTSNTSPVLEALKNAGATVSPTDQAANARALLQSALTQQLFGGVHNTLGRFLNFFA